jgi:hypothetical protein
MDINIRLILKILTSIFRQTATDTKQNKERNKIYE